MDVSRPAHLNELLLYLKQVGVVLAGSGRIGDRVWGLHLLEDWKSLSLWAEHLEQTEPSKIPEADCLEAGVHDARNGGVATAGLIPSRSADPWAERTDLDESPGDGVAPVQAEASASD